MERKKPLDIQKREDKKVIAFLNSVKTVDEIADAIEIPGKRDIGVEMARNLLERRKELGSFKTLKQVDEVPQIGPDRYASIVMLSLARGT